MVFGRGRRVQLKGGGGQAGDSYEQHADAVIEAREKFERMVREHNAWHKSMQAVWAQKRKDQ